MADESAQIGIFMTQIGSCILVPTLCRGFNFEHDCNMIGGSTLKCSYKGRGVYSTDKHTLMTGIFRLQVDQLSGLSISIAPFVKDVIHVEYRPSGLDDICSHFIDIKPHQHVIAFDRHETTTICAVSSNMCTSYPTIYDMTLLALLMYILIK
jgi:hypothetical protein